MEEQLRASEERFRALLESAPDAMLVVDGEGTMVVVNRQAERLFGYSRQELLGQPVEMLMPAKARDSHECHRAAYSIHARSRQMGGGDSKRFVRMEVNLAPRSA
jgi:PAS domain S-box-containing protein